MSSRAKRTIDLDDEQARAVDGLLRSGRIATEADVIHAGLKALQDDDSSLEDWLRSDVVPVAAAMMDDPGRAIPFDDVFDDLRRVTIAFHVTNDTVTFDRILYAGRDLSTLSRKTD